MKKSIIAASLLLSSSFAFSLTDGQAAVLGIIIGSQIQKNYQQEQYQQPRQVYNNPGYSQQQLRDPCANSYSSIDSAYCRGAVQRQREVIRGLEQDAYNRGYNGN